MALIVATIVAVVSLIFNCMFVAAISELYTKLQEERKETQEAYERIKDVLDATPDDYDDNESVKRTICAAIKPNDIKIRREI